MSVGQEAISFGFDNVKTFIEAKVVPFFENLGINIIVKGEGRPLHATIYVRKVGFQIRGDTDVVHPSIIDFRKYGLTFDAPVWRPWVPLSCTKSTTPPFDSEGVLEALNKIKCVELKFE